MKTNFWNITVLALAAAILVANKPACADDYRGLARSF